MTDPIATDSILTAEQRRSLKLLLDMIIPADAKRGMPGAAELDFVGYVSEFANDRIGAIQSDLDLLDEQAHNLQGAAFADLGAEARQSLVDRLRGEHGAGFAQNIVVQTLSCYYQDDRVVTALGMEARPPFPKGNEVLPGDLSLLDPVRKRPRLYRE